VSASARNTALNPTEGDKEMLAVNPAKKKKSESSSVIDPAEEKVPAET